jgi:hypothetical protein|tara:strand:+ start:562 stop:825 length:264 start_codon:yes stop_codon:yes gene_type:complete
MANKTIKEIMTKPFKMKGSPMQRNFGISPVKDDLLQSERARADGASDATVRKLENIEAGEKKKSELTDPVKIARVEKKLLELQPLKT